MTDEMFLGNTYQANVVRTDLTRALPAIVPELVDESALALQEVLEIPEGSGTMPNAMSLWLMLVSDDSGYADSVSLPVWHTMTHLIARVSNRALVGPELCRNKTYTQAMVRFAEFVMIYSYALRFCPVFLRE